MKLKLLTAVLLLSIGSVAHAADCVWTPITGVARTTQSVGAVDCTFGEGAADGINLSGVRTVSITISADEGETIDTLVTLSAYLYNPYLERWVRAPKLDELNTSGLTGVRDQYVDGIIWEGATGSRLAYIASAGAVSSGSLTITLTAHGWRNELK